MKKFVILSFVISSLLIVSLLTTDVVGNEHSSTASPDDDPMPIVNSPLDIVYFEGSTGHNITWEISDDNPSYWYVTRNGVFLTSLDWLTNNKTVTIDVDGLAAGYYEFKIYANDFFQNTTDLVMVAVLPSDVEVHSPITISGDNQFNSTAQSEGWEGNGTAISPYIIEKLHIESSYECIRIYGTTVHFVIRNCTFLGSGAEWQIGITMQSVSNGTIMGCTFANLWIGCMNWFVSDCLWGSNYFGDLTDGIWLEQATDCRILGNSFMSGGLSISGYNPVNWIHEISENLIAGRPIGYFKGLSSLDIDVSPCGQVIVANCSDVQIFNGDVLDAGKGISIAHSNQSIVYDCEIGGGAYGIYLERTHEVTIDDCHVFGSSDVGMYINETSSTTIYNCTIQDIGYAGVLAGIGLNVVVSETVISSCGDVGITSYGASFLRIFNCTIQNNYNGITLGDCPYSLIIGNVIQYNDQYGLHIQWGSENTTMFGNEFRDNGFLNARDDGFDTWWDDGYRIGNMWSDYVGSGYYYVTGSRNGIDHYPGRIDFIRVVEVSAAADQIYTVGTTGHNIVWETNCTYPSLLTVFRDGDVQRQEAWDGSTIVHNIDGLTVGTYNYTLVILDGFAGIASDTVIVTVSPPDPTIITNTTSTTTTTTTTTNTTIPIGLQEITLIISIGSMTVIVVVIILIVRSKDSPM
ncbi:MAG: right-handed parallel beta-helix repeat-containing protein [Candidatus Thorarchaeota archaeon]